MKTKVFSFIIALSFVFLIPQQVAAHGDEPRIEISAERLSPGAVLDIRGVDFEFEEEVSLVVSNPQTEITFGSVLADTEGIFLLSVTLPFDMPEGVYIVRATTDDHVVESVQFTVSGLPFSEGEGEAREEDDALLAPMPTYGPGVSSTPLPEAVNVQSEPAQNTNPLLLLVIAGLGVILAVAVLRMRRG